MYFGDCFAVSFGILIGILFSFSLYKFQEFKLQKKYTQQKYYHYKKKYENSHPLVNASQDRWEEENEQ